MASPAGAMAGLLGGAGVLLVLGWAGARRAPRVADRIGPFVGVPTTGRARGGLSEAPLLAWELLRSRSAVDGATDRDLARRLHRAGRAMAAADYRLERLVWSALGAVGGLVLGLTLRVGGPSPVGLALLVGCGAVAGWSGCDAALRRAVRTRQRVLESQLPALAELLALAVAAGASPVPALETAAATMGGPLGEEVTLAVNEVRSGRSVDEALLALAVRTAVPSVQRLSESVRVALERGTPLAEVLRAQAADARASDRRRLLELAGRKDVLMLVPIVFLVLPSVVLIAIYPGIQALRVVVP